MTHTCTDPGAWTLGLALHMLGIVADPSRIQRESGLSTPLTERDVLRAARAFPVRARAATLTRSRLMQAAVPALAVLRSGGFAVIGKVVEDGVLMQGAGEAAPRLVDLDTFFVETGGRLILLARRERDLQEPGRFDLAWFWSAARKYHKLLAEVVLASFVVQLLGLATPLVFQTVIDKVLVHHGYSTLEVMVAGLALIAVFEALLTGLRTYLFAHTSNRIDVELGASVFRHLLRLPLAYFVARRVGDSVARVRELETIRQFITSSTLTLVIDLAFAALFIAVMFVYSPTLAWIAVGALPVYGVLSVVTGPTFRRRLDEKFRRGAENQAFLVESIGGIETIKAMAVEPQMQQRWEGQLAGYVGASFAVAQVGNVATQVSTLVNKLVSAATLFVGAGLVIDNRLTVGELVAFNMLAAQVTGPILRLVQVWQDFHQVRLSVVRLGDVLNTPAEPRSGGTDGFCLQGAVRLEGITFRYGPGARPVLQDVSLDVPAGQVLGIVGPSGSGKSTITRLVQRLYVPEQGRVWVDGMDASLVDPGQLRSQIGVVLQENVLFNRSIRENIALAEPALSLERVVEAARMAGAHDFIAAMPQGYDTPVGERGVSLSGGQRQRIAIARALVTNPRILIFDEATSALDAESESAIQANMREICRGRTVFIVAHRLSAVRHADRIITVEAGRIAEDGAPDELINRGGRFATLARLQAGVR